MCSSFFAFLENPSNQNPTNLSRLNKMKHLFIPFPLLFLFLFLTITSAQSPAAAPTLPAAAPALPVVAPPPLPILSPAAPAAAPEPSGPTTVTAILAKDGRFTIFIKLLQATKVEKQINSQLGDTSQTGLTIFAPTDGAFSNLKRGTLNSFTDEQKVELVQFHMLPSYISPSQFQTISNPINTQAGASTELFGMNATAIGNQVNITTGETNATVVHTIYTDNQLAVYEVDKVLLPLRFYVPLPPPPPPTPPPKKAPKASPAFVAPVDSSSVNCLPKQVLHAMACVMLVLAAFP